MSGEGGSGVPGSGRPVLSRGLFLQRHRRDPRSPARHGEIAHLAGHRPTATDVRATGPGRRAVSAKNLTNATETKAILLAWRPGHGDLRDADVAAALELARRDPALKVWLERHSDFQRAVAKSFHEIP